MLEVSRELPLQFRLVSMITYFADVKFCRSLFINLARPVYCPSEKIPMELSPVFFLMEFLFKVGYFNAKQNQIYDIICIRIKILEDNFPACWPPQLQYYCRRIARFISVTSNLLLVKTPHISFLPPPLSLSYVFIEIGKYFPEILTYFLADGLLTKLFSLILSCNVGCG